MARKFFVGGNWKMYVEPTLELELELVKKTLKSRWTLRIEKYNCRTDNGFLNYAGTGRPRPSRRSSRT